MKSDLQPRKRQFKIVRYTRSQYADSELFIFAVSPTYAAQELLEKHYPPHSRMALDAHMKKVSGFDRYTINWFQDGATHVDVLFIIGPDDPFYEGSDS